MWSQIKRNMVMLLVIICFTIPLNYGIAQSQTWQETLDDNFDIVETFDNIEDWIGTKSMDVTDESDMPKYVKDSMPKYVNYGRSIWKYYSWWGTYPSTSNKWIADFGPDTRIGDSGKSLIIDLGSKGGPSRLGIYFGDGSPDSGYEDIYLFYMVKIPKNEWPTSIANDFTGTYVEGSPYTYFDSWKFGTFNLGNKACLVDRDGITTPYSSFHIIPHLKRSSYINNGEITIKIEPKDGPTRASTWTTQSIQDYLPGWWGVEFHLKNVADSATTQYTQIDVWTYNPYEKDPEKVARKVLDNWKVPYTTQPFSDKWNYFFFGGNNSKTYTWGPTMESEYYVDDFIINATRIGPKYFDLQSKKMGSPAIPSEDPIIKKDAQNE